MLYCDLVVKGGTLFSMNEDEFPEIVNIAISKGKIVSFFRDEDYEAEEIFDATGMFVTPGFVDSHMHDEFFADSNTVHHALIHQGVTTAVAGHCGNGPCLLKAKAARKKPWLNLSYLVGNACLRNEVGHMDRYTSATPQELSKMLALLEESLTYGALGLSLGLQYEPGATFEEVNALASMVSNFDRRIITVHTRYADKRSVDSVKEAIALGYNNNVRVQISHLASQTMWHTSECLREIEKAVACGVDVGFDCYPYDAFCAKAGSAVFDEGYLERWRGKGPEYLEAVSGRFKGQRLTYEKLAIMRAEEPTALIAGYVLNNEEVELCLMHPLCIIASDGLYTGDGAHPRISGAFPRALRMLVQKGFSWAEALKKATSMPADLLRIDSGRLAIGKTADIVVFKPDQFIDKATFLEPFAPASGLELVIINGKIVLKNGVIYNTPQGAFFVR